MSGPREPYRSASLSKREVDRISKVVRRRLILAGRGIRTGRNLPEGLSLIEPRAMRDRDRRLAGKARRKARKAATS